MTENFWLETIRIIGGILTLVITSWVAIRQVKQGRAQVELREGQKEMKEGQVKLEKEMNGHMSKLMDVSNQVHEQKGKQDQISITPPPPIELKIPKLEVEIKPPEIPPPESPKKQK